MAISTYSELQAAVTNWLAKSNLSARAPEFIALAEARINRVLRTKEMETRSEAETTAGDPYLALPTSFGGVRYVKVTSVSPERQLKPYSPTQIQALNINNESGIPQVYAIVAGSFLLKPTPAAAYTVEIAYYKRVPALSDSETTNWLLSAHPDLYLYGALTAAEPFLMHDERVVLWKSLWDEALRELETQDAHDRWSGGPLLMRTDTGTP